MTATASESRPALAPPTALPEAAAVMARAGGENFPVALRLLGGQARGHLLRVYGFARLVDEIGDSVSGDRTQALAWLEGELRAAFAGEASHPLMVGLQETIQAQDLKLGPFLRLIEANRVDQVKRRYQSWEELRGYCALSADPVGEIVLAVFGAATPERIALSEKVCTALQLIEHCQDVAEDVRAGRVYLPLEDMRRFGCTVEHLQSGPPASAQLRETVAFEVRRARALLAEGAPLIATLRGRAKVAVAAFHAGGLAAAEAIERAGFEVLAGSPRAGRARRLIALARMLAEAGR